MIVLHVSSAKSWRGGEQQIAYLLEELEVLGMDQIVFCPQSSPLAAFCKERGITHETYRKRFSVNPIVARQLSQLVIKQDADIVHLHDSHAHTFGCLAATFFAMNSAMVLHRRVVFPVGQNALSRWKYKNKGIKSIICVSSYVKEVLSIAIGESQKMKVIHSGVNLDRFTQKNDNKLRKEFRIPKDQLVIANVAAITEEKDYRTFVETAALLIQEGLSARFFIIGKGKQEKEIAELIKQKDLGTHFVFTGFRKDIAELLPNIDVLLFTSKSEGLGTTLIDAQLCGIPIVTTKAGGIPEVVENEKTGLLTEVGDAPEMAKKINYLLENKAHREEMIANAKKAVTRFSKESMAKRTLEVYLSILDAK